MKCPAYIVTIPTAWDVVRPMERRSLVYNRSDLHSSFPEADKKLIEGYEAQLLKHSDFICYVSRALMRQELPRPGERDLPGPWCRPRALPRRPARRATRRHTGPPATTDRLLWRARRLHHRLRPAGAHCGGVSRGLAGAGRGRDLLDGAIQQLPERPLARLPPLREDPRLRVGVRRGTDALAGQQLDPSLEPHQAEGVLGLGSSGGHHRLSGGAAITRTISP